MKFNTWYPYNYGKDVCFSIDPNGFCLGKYYFNIVVSFECDESQPLSQNGGQKSCTYPTNVDWF